MNYKDATQWFIFHNPELASGYIDENTKVNKLLYFSNLMYHCVYGEDMLDEGFVAFPNGPVIFSVYRDYRYNGLSQLPRKSPELDKKYEKVLEIINFVYGNQSTKKLVEESHSHGLWQSVAHLIPNNPSIKFEQIDEELEDYNKALFEAYADFDFTNIAKEKICENIYYYCKDSFQMSEEIIDQLSTLDKFDEPKFLEKINGELVIS